MTAQDLRGLEVHLNQELLMKRLYSKKVGTADSRFRSLRMEDTETYEFISFKTSYRGTILNVGDLQLDFIDSLKELIKEKLGQPHRILLEVSFEEGWILSFISTDSGGFELNTSPGGKNIWYQDIKYDSVYGGAGNSLVVDGDYFYDFYMNFQNPGRENFKDYHSERWR